MKIAEISTFCQYSVGNIMKDIQKVALENGHQCRIFYARGNSNISQTIKFSSNLNINISVLRSRLFDCDGFVNTHDTMKLIKLLSSYNPDIIHLHCLHGYYIDLTVLFEYLSKTKIKVVWTMHDCWAFTGHCAYFDLYNCNKWLKLCYKCPAKKDYPKSIFFEKSKYNYIKKKDTFNLLAKDNMVIVSPSHWLDDLVSQSFLNRYEHLVINNGIDDSKFKSKGLQREDILLAVASVWDERKNLKYVLNLAHNLKKWKIVVIGKIENKEILKDVTNIQFIERIENQEELINFYCKAKILINPTLSDNFPTVNLEAQLCGMSVLSFSSGGSKETNIGNLICIDSNTIVDDEYLDNIFTKKSVLVNREKSSYRRMANEYISTFRKLLGDKL